MVAIKGGGGSGRWVVILGGCGGRWCVKGRVIGGSDDVGWW